jgi:hypothetical protein
MLTAPAAQHTHYYPYRHSRREAAGEFAVGGHLPAA